jgi:competence protein ComEC
MKFTSLQPSAEDGLVKNAGSLVLELEYKNFSMLFTGDVENEGEELLIKNLDKNAYDVLKVSHHGSKNATKEAFLEVAKPKIALVSAGVDNIYQHPHPDVLKRLKNIGCTVYETAKKGAITVQTDGNSLTISFLPYRL